MGTPTTSVEFSAREPLELAYNDGAAMVTLHTTSVRSGKRKYDGAFNVLATYRLERTAKGPQLKRQGELSIQGRTQSGSSGELAEAISLLRKFTSVLPPKLTLDDLVPRASSITDKVSALQLAELDTHDGWLIAGYQMPQTAAVVANRR